MRTTTIKRSMSADAIYALRAMTECNVSLLRLVGLRGTSGDAADNYSARNAARYGVIPAGGAPAHQKAQREYFH